MPVDHDRTLTLFDGSAFCLSDRSGNLDAAGHGMFFGDRRLLCRWVLLVDGRRAQALTVAQPRPCSCVVVARPSPEGDLLLIRRRYVGAGLREDVELRNLGRRPARAVVELEVAADLADVFAVKQGRAGAALTPAVVGGGLSFDSAQDDGYRVLVSFTGSPALSPAGARWEVDLPPGGRFLACGAVALAVAGVPVRPSYSCHEPVAQALPERRHRTWVAGAAGLDTEHHGIALAFATAVADLGSLRLFDGEHAEPAVAAGAPWYMTLFGRDSLLTAWMTLPVARELAIGTLEALARLQGTRVDPDTGEEPGKILHEVRTGFGAGDGRYFGSVDATPLFVMLLGEAYRWGMPRDRVQALLPAADAAVGWLNSRMDAEDYVSYTGDAGLVNQGWKDSADGVLFADGTSPEPPIALAEVQGYAYAAFLARARLADAFTEPAVAHACRNRAARLRGAFHRDFWLPERGWYALALDGHGRRVDALGSHLGHCLWTGIVDPSVAADVADRLVSPELFSGWGLRTLATTMAAYHPLSYHNGSVWPHDTAIAVAGLTRYGFGAAAARLGVALVEAAETFGGRLPELFSGLDRSEVPVPVSYPSSCSPQAWASGAPLLVLASLLRLEPDAVAGRLSVSPVLPPPWGALRLHGVRLSAARLDVAVSAEGSITVTPADGGATSDGRTAG